MKKLIGLSVTLANLLILFLVTPAFARSINLSEAGWTLWIFVIIGAAIVLLQLIPAAILFFSFVGTTIGFTKKEKPAEAIEGIKEIA